jgi:sarcosine oxidase/N-methyl-L-tryptophan oxidase
MPMQPANHFEAIVLGGGTMGSAAAWALGKRGVRTLVLEQFRHVHALGAHSGKTRIIRHAYAEGPEYVPLVQRADALWQELEAATGRQVLHRTGGLDMSAPGNTQARDARRSAEHWGLPFEWLTGAEVRARWPQFLIPDEWEACYSPQAGFLRVEPALHGLGDAARALGVKIREEEPVRAWSGDGGGVRVETDRATYRADRLIVTAGAWAGRLLADLGLPLTVRRKTLFWFAVDDPASFAPDRFPIFIADLVDAGMYGFPILAEPGIKVANHRGGLTVDPDTVDRTVHPGEEADVAAFVTTMLRGVTGRVVESAACLYTLTPDEDFVLDRHPAVPGVVFGAGFSGHGFKFATAVGEHLVDLVSDPSTQPYRILTLNRFAATPA